MLALHMVFDVQQEDLVFTGRTVEPGQDLIQTFCEVTITGTAAQMRAGPMTEQEPVWK